MKGFAISLGLHLGVLFALVYQWPAAPAAATVPPTAVKLFVPADAAPEKAVPPQRNQRPAVAPQRQNPSPQNKTRLDLATIQLTIEDDFHGEMIVVLKRYHGKFAIIDPRTRVVQAAFWASTAKPVSGVAVTDNLAILLGGPAYWPEVAALEGGGEADTAVCALFPPDFTDALGAAIQKKAAEQGVVDIKGATFAFSSHESSGIMVRRVV